MAGVLVGSGGSLRFMAVGESNEAGGGLLRAGPMVGCFPLRFVRDVLEELPLLCSHFGVGPPARHWLALEQKLGVEFLHDGV